MENLQLEKCNKATSPHHNELCVINVLEDKCGQARMKEFERKSNESLEEQSLLHSLSLSAKCNLEVNNTAPSLDFCYKCTDQQFQSPEHTSKISSSSERMTQFLSKFHTKSELNCIESIYHKSKCNDESEVLSQSKSSCSCIPSRSDTDSFESIDTKGIVKIEPELYF